MHVAGRAGTMRADGLLELLAPMLAKRIIPCLDVTAGRVVKGVNFVNLRDAGDPVELARRTTAMARMNWYFSISRLRAMPATSWPTWWRERRVASSFHWRWAAGFDPLPMRGISCCPVRTKCSSIPQPCGPCERPDVSAWQTVEPAIDFDAAAALAFALSAATP